MAEYLASIFGTEKDKVNCSFYFKIGACRHGDRCSRIHNKPTFSQTILIQNLYQNPQNVPQGPDGQPQGVSLVSDEEAQEHFDDFFQDVFVELEDKYGEIEEMNVCDNLGDHLIGNVYIKFRREEDAERAVKELNNRWFNGKPVYAELSPVTDFREACCRQYEMGECTRSGFCNFMHLKPISRELRRELYGRRRPGRRSRSRSPKRRPRERTPDRRRRSKSREHKRRRSRSRSKRREIRTEEPRSRSRDRRRRSEEHRNGSSHKPDPSMPLDKEQINIEINSNLDEILNAASCDIKLEQHNGNRHEKQLPRDEEEDDHGTAQTQVSSDQHASQESYQNQEELYYQDFGPVKAEPAQEEQNYQNDYEQQQEY